MHKKHSSVNTITNNVYGGIIIFIKAFIIGGAICVIGQLLVDLTSLTPGKILVGFVIAGVILGGAGVYKYLTDFAGCGATVPLLGFGSLLAEGTKEAVIKDGITGILTGPLSTGAAGISAAAICGVICSLLVKPKAK